MPAAGWRKSSVAIGSGEKNEHRLNRCSASAVSSVIDIAQVPETGAESSESVGCSLSSWWAFSGNRARYSSTLWPSFREVRGRVLDGDGQVAERRRPAAWPR